MKFTAQPWTRVAGTALAAAIVMLLVSLARADGPFLVELDAERKLHHEASLVRIRQRRHGRALTRTPLSFPSPPEGGRGPG